MFRQSGHRRVIREGLEGILYLKKNFNFFFPNTRSFSKNKMKKNLTRWTEPKQEFDYEDFRLRIVYYRRQYYDNAIPYQLFDIPIL